MNKPCDRLACKQCSTECRSDSLQCKICEHWYHAKCESVSPQQFSLFLQLDKLNTHYEWLCNSCRNGDALNVLKSIHAMQAKISNFDSEMVSLKKTCSIIPLLEEKVKQLEESVSQSTTSALLEGDSLKGANGFDIDNLVTDAVNEALDVERRKLNLTISGLQPSETKSDGELIQELFEDPSLNVTGTVVVSNCQRVGKKGLLIVTFDTLESKRNILKNAYKLKSSTNTGYRSVYISPDLTRKQRIAEYQLRTELRERRNKGENNLRISRGKIVVSVPHQDKRDRGIAAVLNGAAARR